jgi:hypothetical protein
MTALASVSVQGSVHCTSRPSRAPDATSGIRQCPRSLGTGVDNVVTDNVPSPWVRVKVYRPLDPGVPLTLAVALHEAAVSCCRRMRERALALAQHSKMDELDGGGSCTGGSMKIGPSLPIGSGQGASVVTSYTPPRPSQLPRMLCSPMGTASSLSRGRILKGSAPSPSASERQSG